MNILIPHNWLKDHLKTKATPAQIQKYLSLCGPSVERIEKIKGKAVYDIEVTTNRVDSMSVRGIAREAAVILPEFKIKANLKEIDYTKKHGLGVKLGKNPELDIKITNDPKLCHRILAVKLENVQIGSSPQWLINRLEQVNQRSLNNAIDITNYVMWEIGHPIHAFDYDLITTKQIIVRLAKKGEKLTTLDNKTYTLKGGEVIFDDGTGTIIDLPGIMGTKNTVISKRTKNVLLWIESVDAAKIRFASMTHAIRSQAAILNEKNVDPELGPMAIHRAINLFIELAKAKPASQLRNIYPKAQIGKTITLKEKTLQTYLGMKLKPPRVIRILGKLGCAAVHKKKGYTITPPSWRSRDLRIPQDYIEEIARIYGYHNLPSVLMDTPIPDNPPNENFKLENKIKNILVGWGLQEVYSYSLVSSDLAQSSGFKLGSHLKIKNPLTDEMVYMRRSIIPSLVEAIHQNQRDKVSLFEMQNVYHPRKDSQLPNEELQLVISTTENYAYLKGILDYLSQKLFITNLRVEPTSSSHEIFQADSKGDILINGTKVGVIGKVKNTNVFSLMLKMRQFIKLARAHPKFIPIHQKPPIIEDLTFSLPQKTFIGHVLEEISLSHKLIDNVVLSQTYKPNKSSKTNFTFTIHYRHPRKSLKDSDIDPIRKKIVKLLAKHFNAQLIGKLQ